MGTHHHHGDGPGEHTHEVLPGPSPVASVVLDIGEGVGALIVRTTPDLDGQEIEIRRCGDPWRGVHTAVRRRVLPAGHQFAAVYGSLPAGRHELRRKGSADERPVLTVDVAEAAVAGAVWPDSPSEDRTAGRTVAVGSGPPR